MLRKAGVTRITHREENCRVIDREIFKIGLLSSWHLTLIINCCVVSWSFVKQMVRFISVVSASCLWMK